jgi:hypothetical protein
MMQRAHRISMIERMYPDEWVLIEVSRSSTSRGALAGRVLAHSPDEHEITKETVKARQAFPSVDLFAFYTGDLIPEGMTVILGCR